MWFGAVIAIWSTFQMFLFGKGTPLVATPPKKIISVGSVQVAENWSSMARQE